MSHRMSSLFRRHQPSDEEEEDGWEEDDEGWEGGDQDSIWTPGRGGATKRPPEEGFTRSLRKASGAGGGTGAKRCKRRSASLGSGNQASGTGAGRPHTTAHRASHHHLSRSSNQCADSQTVSPGHLRPMEQEKRIRREIANSNERRRMQSINAGFQSLRTLLPHHEGEKLSKVSGRKG
ncbi:hypothetical protein J437_LFUL007827 [Ladona fulva]|uniref:BHLH domain-containing protein n=1 Tax=Ladona fulva TaxID=123851 RepID=A0A8K0NWX0_LADFU|nr:hypothetical protein J437_LFUL007827 [Ladona fulva]